MLLMCEEIECSDWYNDDLKPTLLDTRMVQNLSNTTPLIFMGFGCYRFGCYIADFDYRPHYSFVEQLVMQENGAIAACGMSRQLSEVTLEDYHAALNGAGGIHFEVGHLLIENLCDGKMPFGQALGNAQEEYSKKHEGPMDSSRHRIAVFGLTLIGDPTLKLLR